MPDSLMDLLGKAQRAAIRAVCYAPDARPVTDLLDQALALAEQQQAEMLRLFRLSQRNWTDSPAFETFCTLKHGPFGRALAALQEGMISRGRAAEILAEIAHGATEIRLPVGTPQEPTLGDDESPVDALAKQQAEIERLRKLLCSWQWALDRYAGLADTWTTLQLTTTVGWLNAVRAALSNVAAPAKPCPHCVVEVRCRGREGSADAE
jgi:hypothetical protein